MGSRPSFSQASPSRVPDDNRNLRLWPLILLVIGGAMELMAIGLFVREETEDKRNGIDFANM